MKILYQLIAITCCSIAVFGIFIGYYLAAFIWFVAAFIWQLNASTME